MLLSDKLVCFGITVPMTYYANSSNSAKDEALIQIFQVTSSASKWIGVTRPTLDSPVKVDDRLQPENGDKSEEDSA